MSPLNTTPLGVPRHLAVLANNHRSIQIYAISNPNATPKNAALPDCTRDPLCSIAVCDTSLSIEDRATALVNALTLQEKIANSGGNAPGAQRIALPPYTWDSEALHGVAISTGVHFQSPFGANFSYATSFPVPLSLAAAFDDPLLSNVGAVIGKEARAFYNFGFASLTYMTPTLNPYRDPRWGRGLETPGEDIFRIQKYLSSLVPALQGGVDASVKQIVATCKHFAAYDIETGRNSNNLDPTAQDFAEYYARPFRACTRDAKGGATMCSYNAVDGIPSCANRYQLQTVLRETYDFNSSYNFVIGDCGAVENVFDNHHYASSYPEAAALSLNAGVDVDCGNTYQNYLNVSILQNMTTEAALDQSLVRLYSALLQAGYFNAPEQYSSLTWADVNTPAAQTLAYQAAVEGAVLLKNDGTLPLPESLTSNAVVAVIGPLANATTQMQGIYYGLPPYLVSPLMAFQGHLSASSVQYAFGTQINTTSTVNFTATLDAARASDYIVYVGGIDTSIEAEALDRTAITWPGNQLDLIDQLSRLGKPLVVVQGGAGQLDDSSLLNNTGVNAILWMGYPGQDGGNAVFDILTGAASVAGRLPVTQYPAAYTSEVSMFDMTLRPSLTSPGRTYKWYTGIPVLSFGHGLHYTNFSVSWAAKQPPPSSYNIASLVHRASGPNIDLAPFINIVANVTNVGGPANLASDYVVLLFLSSSNAGPAPRPIKQLVSYGRLHNISVGSTQQLNFSIDLGSLMRADDNGNMNIYPGDYTLAMDVDSKITFKFSLKGSATQVETFPQRPQNQTAFEDLGCYAISKKGSSSNAVLSGPSPNVGNSNSPQFCVDLCAQMGYYYAAVMTRYVCYPSTSLPYLPS